MAQTIKWNDLTPLQDENDYEPDEDQIIDYAQYIGLVLPEDNKYLFIAKEGLKAKLPPFWQACQDANGQLYFRNRKTRVIVIKNPLDQIYVQKVRQIKQLAAQTNIFSIQEESALNQSSGLVKSRPKAELRKSDKQSSQAQANRILERHITEESIYSENLSVEKTSPRRSEVQEEPQWKVQLRTQLANLRGRIQRFVPAKNQLITHIRVEDRGDLSSILKVENLARLEELRLEVETKQVKLEQRKRERRDLQRTLDQMRAHSRPL